MRREHETIQSLRNDDRGYEIGVVVEFGVNTVEVRLHDPDDPEMSYGKVEIDLIKDHIIAEVTGELASAKATLFSFEPPVVY